MIDRKQSRLRFRVGLSCALGVMLVGGLAIGGGPIANDEGALPPALDAPAPVETTGGVVQVALLLDTSNSMDGLIDQARAQLWAVVNDFALARHDCDPVQLQVALYQYGNDVLEAADGHVQLRVAFTTDLDVVSEQLFSLRTDGGSEYCGWVIRDAAEELAWIAPRQEEGEAPILRMIVIAGNEPFSQGSVPYASAIASAIGKGIKVHTVHCGDVETGESTFWKDGATLGEGRYCAIDQDHVEVQIDTPFDAMISTLNTRFNETYIPYGTRGREASLRQTVQDSNNAHDSYAFNSRAKAKSSIFYTNESWDLVDAYHKETVDLEKLDRSTLPEKLQRLTLKELRGVIESSQARRGEIRASLQSQLTQRERFLAEHRTQETDSSTLESALIGAIREAVRGAGLSYEDGGSE